MNLVDILQQPVPDYSAGRDSKTSFRTYPLKHDGTHNAEPLVDIASFGIAGQSYYSRQNGATGKPVDGVSPIIYVRQSIAELIATINYALQQSSEVEELLGGQVELYVNEGYRSESLQRQLYEETFPGLIRKQHPSFSDKEVAVRRDQLIAMPPRKDSPSPHATGAAVDVRLRYAQPDLAYVAGCDVRMAHMSSDTSEAVYPDYYEHQSRLNKLETEIRRNRRIFYWIMRGALLDDDSGFTVNPTEWWHWSYGDQMWAQLTHAPEAFFAAATPPPVRS
jgi:D-alanyl-D-alanine dipeptidase